MSLLRSARFPAIMLLAAAALGLILANSPIASGLADVLAFHIGIPGTTIDLSVAHWISDGLLAIFFFTAAIELRQELTTGQLRSPRRALIPAIAAAGGVIVPIAVYLLIAGGSADAGGWPIPTATDIAFALGVLAVFGRGLPSNVRVFLLALAILDDIVGIVFIAVLFTADVQILPLAIALILVALFAMLSRAKVRANTKVLHIIALGFVAAATWVAVLESGVHATIAGVALGFALAPRLGDRARHVMEPAVNGVVLPIFAFAAAAVTLPNVGGALSPAFWGVLVALPVGKLIGITLAGWIAQKLFGRDQKSLLPMGDLLAAGALGGIGFTVSLLLGDLAFGGSEVAAEVTIAVLAGSMISMLLSGVLVTLRARHYRRLQRTASRERGDGSHSQHPHAGDAHGAV